MSEDKTEPWGLLLLDKPEGVTSHTAVNIAARALGIKKAGHAGTLDPLATGLMLVGIGRGTRLLEYLVGCGKTYDAVVRLGVETDTLDREGEILSEDLSLAFTRPEIEAALDPFRGEITQVVPRHSAVKVGGVPLHRRARRGEEIEPPARRVTISRLELTQIALPDITLSVDCSSGTYIRSLARDLGRELGTAASLWGLRRTRCGTFSVEGAVRLEALKGMEPAMARGLLLSPELMVEDLPCVTLTEGQADALRHGAKVALEPLTDATEIAAFTEAGGLMAICSAAEGMLIPNKVLD